MSNFMPVFISKVYAEPIKPVEEIKLYVSAQYISQCIGGKGLKDAATLAELEAGDFVNQAGSDLFGAIGKIGGYNLFSTLSFGQKCDKSSIKKAMDALNISVNELLLSTGIYRLSSNPGNTYDAQDISNEQAAINILNATTIKHPDGVNFRGPLSNVAKYYVLKDAFMYQCKDKRSPGNSDGISVEVIDDTGKQETVKYVLKVNKNDEVIISPNISGNELIGKMKCSDIVTNMNDLAKTGIAAQIVALGGSGGNTSDEDPNGSDSCQEKTGLITGWLICSGMELLSKGMDAVMDQVDNMLNVDFSLLNTKSGDGLKNAWNVFRIMANFMLFAVAIVMIISQAMGGGS